MSRIDSRRAMHGELTALMHGARAWRFGALIGGETDQAKPDAAKKAALQQSAARPDITPASPMHAETRRAGHTMAVAKVRQAGPALHFAWKFDVTDSSPRISPGQPNVRRSVRTSPIDANTHLAAVATAVVIDASVIPGTRIHEHVPRQLRTDARAQAHP